MGISFILAIGILGVLVLVLFSNSILDVISRNNRLVNSLRRKKLFQHYGRTGIFTFLMNALLFVLTLLTLYGIQFFTIPFFHLIVMVVAVGVSLYLWLVINLAWQGSAKDRLKVGVIGSSFYVLLTAFFVYKYVTIEPMFPGDDPFMRAIGFMFGMMVAMVAFVTCLFLTGFAKGKKEH